MTIPSFKYTAGTTSVTFDFKTRRAVWDMIGGLLKVLAYSYVGAWDITKAIAGVLWDLVALGLTLWFTWKAVYALALYNHNATEANFQGLVICLLLFLCMVVSVRK